MTKLISNLRAFLFGTTRPPVRPGTLYEHVHIGRRVRPTRDGLRKPGGERGDRGGESSKLEVTG